MGLRRLALGGALLALSAMLAPGPSVAGGLPALDQGAPASTLEHKILHGHAKRSTSFYCYPRNYWWFYRPYTTAAQGHARCMPYFHYPPEGLRGGRGPYGIK